MPFGSFFLFVCLFLIFKGLDASEQIGSENDF